jgi:protein gp37
MGDLFHPDVPFSFLDKVFAVMAVSSQHTFVICTKRAERMREYLSAKLTPRSVANATAEYADTYPTCGWPLPNVHLGVTCESQEQTGRVIDLVATPAAHRWVSYEPALGPLDIETWLSSCEECGNAGSSALFGHRPPGDGLNLCRDACDRTEGPGIDGVIIGCESGPNRRPCDLAWVRQVVGDCQAGGVECYVKQLDIDGKVVTDMAKFPKWARVRQLPWMTESEAT